MIAPLTTLIVGAGASKPYGYPTGPQLRDEANRITPDHQLYQLMVQANIASPDDILHVVRELNDHKTLSIDAFLEHKQDNAVTMKVGRALIAAIIGNRAWLQSQPQAPKAAHNEDWLSDVVEQIRAGTRKWADVARRKGRLTFVTFNFDDVIERYLARSMRSIYSDAPTDEDVQNVMPVIHVHGRLPAPARDQFRSDTFHGFSPAAIEWMRSAPEFVRLILDPIHGDGSTIDPSDLARARAAIMSADIICFLGFSYATENLRGRLDLPNGLGDRRPLIFGSAWEEPQGRRDRVQSIFSNAGHSITLGAATQNCRELLREHYILREDL